MDIFSAIDTRKTIRKYGDYIPTQEEIKRIINSARLAPSAINAQNWKFIAIYNSEIKHQMAQGVLGVYDEILSKVDSEAAQNVERYKGHSTFFEKSPVVIACILTPSRAFMCEVLEKAGYSIEDLKLMRPDSQILSMGGAIENMSLAAHALGLGTCWMGAPVLAAKSFSKILNLAEGERVVSLLTVGKPFEENSNRSPKKDLDEIMEIIE